MIGFGDPEKEYWIGLEPIHMLTTQLGRRTLYVRMIGPDGTPFYVVYKDFSVGDSTSGYKMNLGEKVKGTASDSLRYISV